MSRDLRELLDELQPATILIEWTKGKVGERRHQGRGAGLAVYGGGMGYATATADSWAADGCQVVGILENDWTRGVKKETRQLAVASMFDDYRASQDPGGDMADAIGMAVWWLKQRSLFR